MTVRRTGVLIGAATALALLVLPGCAPASHSTGAATSEPSATSAPAPSAPTPSPEPVEPTTLVLGGESAVLTATAGTVGDYPYGAPADQLLASLTTILGAPETVVHQGEKCVNDSVDSVWGGLTVSYYGMDAASAPQLQVTVRDDVAGLVVESSHGARVGGSWPEFLSTIPDAPMTTGEYQGRTWGQAIDGNYAAWGAAAGALVNTDDSATIDMIVAPLDLGHDC
jgi:hypothetical protein